LGGWFDWGEGVAMDGAGAEFLDGGEVGCGAVAFVLGEAVAGVLGIVLEHEPVPGDFGDD
jgi:hypothetical protein